MGELVLFDTARGRREAEGVVQRIPGHGQKVEPVILDGLTGGNWPAFPPSFPAFGEVFPRLLPADEERALGDLPRRRFRQLPAALRATGAGDDGAGSGPEDAGAARHSRAMSIPGERKRRWSSPTFIVGDGLRGVPRGTSRRCASSATTSASGGWAARSTGSGSTGRGTSGDSRDGACRGGRVRPLHASRPDADRRCNRSTTKARPCNSCEAGSRPCRAKSSPASAATRRRTRGSRRSPSGAAQRRRTHPALVRPGARVSASAARCSRSSTGTASAATTERRSTRARPIADLTSRPDMRMQAGNKTYNKCAHFPPSYFELKRFVRGATIESDAHLLTPWDFHADSTKLIQMLRKGHHGVATGCRSLGSPGHVDRPEHPRPRHMARGRRCAGGHRSTNDAGS